jgi:hypothetical protein
LSTTDAVLVDDGPFQIPVDRCGLRTDWTPARATHLPDKSSRWMRADGGPRAQRSAG